MHRRPAAEILDIAAEFFEAECPVRAGEEINATIMLVIFDALEDKP